ncbi:MAG: choice-of-anchor B family protein [Bacteroidota bacterium]|nr:choice-of-anchor B family protein [Bacteroidota bacterium]
MTRSLSFALFMLVLAILAAPAQAQQFGSTTTAAGDALLVADTNQPTLPGTIYVYRNADGQWSEAARMTAGTRAENGDRFGHTMASDGSRLVVGTAHQRIDIFAVQADGGFGYETSLNGESEGFGMQVAVSGDRILVTSGAPTEAAARVQIWLYDQADGWGLESELAAPDGAVNDGFGTTLAFDGSIALVGAPTAADGSGAVYAFSRDEASGVWSLRRQLNTTFPAEGSGFCSSIWMSGSLAAIGAPGFGGGAGIVALYRTDGTDWSPIGRLAGFASDRGDRFGQAIAGAQGQIVVGAPGAGGRNGTGAVFAFSVSDEISGLAASRTSLVPSPDLQPRSQFGGSIVALDHTLLVGAPGLDNRAGAVFIRDVSSSDWAGPFVNETFGYESMSGDMRECAEGTVGDFPCEGVDVMSFVSMGDLGADRGIRTNDIWGWEDPETGREYAIVGMSNATSFVDVTDPFHPQVIGTLRMTETANMAVWRDMKVYRNHAYIVSDGAGQHGMQIFDLTRLRSVENAPVEFEADGLYEGIFSAHNIVINEETGFGYSVGSSAGGTTCGGGLHMIDLRDPKNPTFAGCFSDGETGRRGTGYSHDAQCVVYHGPDRDYQGQEICVGSNETAISIADVTDKDNPVSVAIASYPNVAYTHQGWFTDDQRYFYVNDEIDEARGLVDGTRTLIWDLADLDDPVLAGEYVAETTETDHNLYVKGNLMYQSNTAAGLRIIDITDPENPFETAFFDTSPVGGRGVSWSNYPYYRSGTIAVTAGHYGLFLLKKREVDL